MSARMVSQALKNRFYLIRIFFQVSFLISQATPGTSAIVFIKSAVGFPFAKLLRNFCGTKRKIFLSLRISFARKKQQFTQSFAKVISRKIGLFRFCETQVLRNSATRVLRNFVKIKRLVTVCVS